MFKALTYYLLQSHGVCTRMSIPMQKVSYNQFYMLITLIFFFANDQLGFYQETDSTVDHANVTILIRVTTRNDLLDESIFICS